MARSDPKIAKTPGKSQSLAVVCCCLLLLVCCCPGSAVDLLRLGLGLLLVLACGGSAADLCGAFYLVEGLGREKPVKIAN
jgi:hypothetical protein